MYYIDDIPLTDASLLAGTTLAEDPTSVWASGTFAVGNERHVVQTHRVYKDTVGGASSVRPDLDTTGRWTNMRPTNLWAPFDPYTNTAAKATVDITYVISGRFVNFLMLRGLVGRAVVVSIKKAPGGATIYPAKTFLLRRPAQGYWDYAFGQRKAKTALNIGSLPMSSTAEITITVTASSTSPRAVGLILPGKLRAIHGTVGVGGTEPGASVDPKTYTYRKSNADGTFTSVLRGSSKDINLSVFMPIAQADTAAQELEGMLSRPVGILATLTPGYDGVSGFGWIKKSPLVYHTTYATCNVSQEGIV